MERHSIVPPEPALARAAHARGRLAEGHPTYDHFHECSPCYREMKGIQQTKQPRSMAVISYFGRNAGRALRLYAYRRLRLWRDAASVDSPNMNDTMT